MLRELPRSYDAADGIWSLAGRVFTARLVTSRFPSLLGFRGRRSILCRKSGGAGMKTPSFLSLGGVAVMSACACGTSSSLSKIAQSYGMNYGGTPIHHAFVLVGGTMMVAGLWQRERKAALLGAGAVSLLTIGEVLLPIMGINAGARLPPTGLAGVAAYLLAGVLLVLAFRRAYQFQQSTASVVAMSGMAMSVGCNCCLVAQGVSG